MLPSEYIERHFHFGYMTDTFGIQQPRRTSASSGSSGRATTRTSAPTGRNSWRTIQAAFCGVPADERRPILAGNAQRLYGFGA